MLSVEAGAECAPVILEALVWFKHPILVLWELHVHIFFSVPKEVLSQLCFWLRYSFGVI